MRPSRMLAVAGLTVLPFLPVLSSAPTAAEEVELSPAMEALLDWNSIAITAVYVDGRVVFPPSTTPVAVPAPVAPLYLGFTSLAVRDALETAMARGGPSAAAAVASAAHDVLTHYLPNTAAFLDAKLVDTLADVPDGPAQRKGVRIGRQAAAELIASRAGEVLGGSFPYQLDPTIAGIWTPAPTGHLASWLGYVDPLVVHAPVPLDGPPALTSDEYAADVAEVQLVGSKAGTNAQHKAIADFYYVNNVPAAQRALIAYLRNNPVGARRTATMFAVMHASMSNAIIQVWKMKLELGFWRPSMAINRADEDNNPKTVADPTWEPYRANPPYAEYASGHAAIMGSFGEAVRRYLGDAVPLTLVSVPQPTPLPSRSYPNLTALENEMYLARIYAGIHFRDSMDDGYHLAHETVHRVAAALG